MRQQVCPTLVIGVEEMGARIAALAGQRLKEVRLGLFEAPQLLRGLGALVGDRRKPVRQVGVMLAQIQGTQLVIPVRVSPHQCEH